MLAHGAVARAEHSGPDKYRPRRATEAAFLLALIPPTPATSMSAAPSAAGPNPGMATPMEMLYCPVRLAHDLRPDHRDRARRPSRVIAAAVWQEAVPGRRGVRVVLAGDKEAR